MIRLRIAFTFCIAGLFGSSLALAAPSTTQTPNGLSTKAEFIKWFPKPDWEHYKAPKNFYFIAGLKGFQQTTDVLVLADPFDRYDDAKDGYTYVNANVFYWLWFDALLFDKLTWRTMITAVPKKK